MFRNHTAKKYLRNKIQINLTVQLNSTIVVIVLKALKLLYDEVYVIKKVCE